MVLGGLEVVGKRSVRSKAKLEIIPKCALIDLIDLLSLL